MNSIELLAATLFSSVVGSLHCVGMCSPFAMLALGSAPASHSKGQRVARLSSYHLGRLATYLLMGTAVAIFKGTLQAITNSHGISTLWIGWSVGIVMIGIGTTRMVAVTSGQNSPVQHSDWLLRWTRGIVSLRRRYAGGPPWLVAFLWGLSSTFLPCGWLYFFVLAAAAAPSSLMTLATMVAFWIGTLPLLTVAAWSWSSINRRWQLLAQPIAPACIIAFGIYILLHRSDIDLSSLTANKPSLEMIRDAMNLHLPCCVGGK